MILQTLYQNCVKHDVQFFNEFYALDLVLTQTPSGPVATGVVAYELATGEIHVFHGKAIVLATGDSGPHVQDHLQRTHADRRRHRHRLPQRDFPWRTWSFTNFTRPAWPVWAS